MALCAYHEDTEAIATCVTCKSPICDKCKDFGADGMCGMCLEVANARKTNLDHARAAAAEADATAPPPPKRKKTPTGPPAAPPPKPRQGAPAKGTTGKLRTPTGALPESGAKPRTPTGALAGGTPAKAPAAKKRQISTRNLVALVALLLVALLGYTFYTPEDAEPSEELVLELRQRMGLVKTAILSYQERTGRLPDDVNTIEVELRKRDFEVDALNPPLRIVMDRTTSRPYAVVLKTVEDGIELTATDGTGKVLTLQGRPVVLDAHRRAPTLQVSPSPQGAATVAPSAPEGAASPGDFMPPE